MSEEQILSKQVTECMEFLIWLKGYEYTDGPIQERLEGLLHVLAASAPQLLKGNRVTELDDEQYPISYCSNCGAPCANIMAGYRDFCGNDCYEEWLDDEGEVWG